MAEINNEKVIKKPRKSSKLAELVGIILGDGSINICNSKKGYGTYSLKIAGDSRHDKIYFNGFVKPLIDSLFNVDSKFYYFKNKNCVHLYVSGKRLVDFLISIGLKEGNKIKNQVGFPGWIWEKRLYVRSCLRGLVDTDGTIYELLPHWPGLFQISFDNRSLPLLRDVRRAFLELGFTPSKIHGNRTSYGNKVSITRKKDIQKFYKEIRFHNQRHLHKYSPVV